MLSAVGSSVVSVEVGSRVVGSAVIFNNFEVHSHSGQRAGKFLLPDNLTDTLELTRRNHPDAA